ncbi:MAG TPA: hydrogenase maturation nickel metallochaperone HypA [Ignavibacteria bacterium]|nr:hydrogenase maturation nickel metallochaperone HypA [Ignavibacteria bacterium]
MHELSLARDIADIVYQNVPSTELNHVKFVVVKIGEFSGVVVDSLKFSYEAIVSETELKNSGLEIIYIPFRLKCNSCGKTSYNEFGMMICEECGSGNTEIISGNELQVVEVKLNSPCEQDYSSDDFKSSDEYLISTK